MDEKPLAELRENFQHFDRDRNGRIDFAEFVRLMDALQAELSEEEARIGFETIDRDGSGRIDFDEFHSWWSSH